ncbi:hypothetical protein AQUCO_02100149v1 [Aquilegia coerulea]|uniref:Uncharacterized protein n=1 Tax=Aquilegia coerulea TaxID=218851 RepID=A0A2G5DF23_AQUCA|nr:hypothetical protein AQUCO_02100149v1 [Aquilegia coerulea]
MVGYLTISSLINFDLKFEVWKIRKVPSTLFLFPTFMCFLHHYAFHLALTQLNKLALVNETDELGWREVKFCGVGVGGMAVRYNGDYFQ